VTVLRFDCVAGLKIFSVVFTDPSVVDSSSDLRFRFLTSLNDVSWIL